MARQRIDGLKELDRALAQLPKSTGKSVLRRVGKKSLQPVIATAKSLVPVDEGELRNSLAVSTKLSKRQKSRNRRALAGGKATVEMFAGATALPHAHLVEFGTSKMAPQPFFRPAWDQTQRQVLRIISSEMGDEITKAAARLARKKAKLAAKG